MFPDTPTAESHINRIVATGPTFTRGVRSRLPRDGVIVTAQSLVRSSYPEPRSPLTTPA